MRPKAQHYPVDRYLVESNKNIEMVNIIDDEIWNSEPALRPEDEITLRKLHDMLQSTADDLKLLSGELSKFHEPKVQIRTTPLPLDEEFNDMVHIEEVVNAKFHGYKIVDKPPILKSTITDSVDRRPNCSLDFHKTVPVNIGVQTNVVPKIGTINNAKKLGFSRTKVIEVNGAKKIRDKVVTDSIKGPSVVAYKEISYKYSDKSLKCTQQKLLNLSVQEMPSVNIRNELCEQIAAHIDIFPNIGDNAQVNQIHENVGVYITQHENENVPCVKQYYANKNKQTNISDGKPSRKISILSEYDSSVSSVNHLSSGDRVKIPADSRGSDLTPKFERYRINTKKSKINVERPHISTQEWKRKLNKVYSQPSTVKDTQKKHVYTNKKASKKLDNMPPNELNNVEYIPYSQLTVGGMKVSDIEKEISNIPNNRNKVISSVMDKILVRQKNNKEKIVTPNVLSTSDENLLREVMNLEHTLGETLSKNEKEGIARKILIDPTDSGKEPDEVSIEYRYDDDFEEEKSDKSKDFEDPKTGDVTEDNNSAGTNSNMVDLDKIYNKLDKEAKKDFEASALKISTLSLKNSVDIHEFIHAVDTQDHATQSTAISQISLKDTQTSPINETVNVRPIHNNFWSSIDPKGEVEKLFKMEKDFIKTMIIEEYGDIIKEKISKPSGSQLFSKPDESMQNIIAAQKNTQTSPARVKNVTTSPPKTKTRTTSPFSVSLMIDHQTSPIMFNENDKLEIKIENNTEELGISLNLLSPRFNLSVPQTSNDILCYIGNSNRSMIDNSKIERKIEHNENRTFNQTNLSSSSSPDADWYSSDISSIGEIKQDCKRRIRHDNSSLEDSLTSISPSDVNSGILPLKSEGEISLELVQSRKRVNGSDGEVI